MVRMFFNAQEIVTIDKGIYLKTPKIRLTIILKKKVDEHVFIII